MYKVLMEKALVRGGRMNTRSRTLGRPLSSGWICSVCGDDAVGGVNHVASEGLTEVLCMGCREWKKSEGIGIHYRRVYRAAKVAQLDKIMARIFGRGSHHEV